MKTSKKKRRLYLYRAKLPFIAKTDGKLRFGYFKNKHEVLNDANESSKALQI
jgi:hypothetical protein